MLQFTPSQKSQRGSLMIEIFVVLGLMAVIAPLLIQQINRRNQEIVDTNVASQMRSVKDAVSAYIQVSEYDIARSEEMGLVGSDGQYIEHPTLAVSLAQTADWQNISLMLPEGADEDNNGILDMLEDLYTIRFYGRTVESGYRVPTGGTEEAREYVYRPVIYALIVQNDPMPSLRRAAKVASMIGIDGGVVTDIAGTIEGMEASWRLTVPGTPKNSVAVVTAFESGTTTGLLKDAKIQHFSGETMQAEGAGIANRLHAMEYFSIGQGDRNCIKNYGTNSVTVLSAGEKIATDVEEACAPLFEVDSVSGNVVLRSGIKAFEGDQGVTLTGTDLTEDGKYDVYQVDPAYTSVMNDIKLTSRGGARLSEILPNYITKDILTMTGSKTGIVAPSCPAGYRQAITVHPTTMDLGITTVEGDPGAVTKRDTQLLVTITPDTGSSVTSGYQEGAVASWDVSMQLINSADAPRTASNTQAVIYTYCVFDAEVFGLPTKDRPAPTTP